MNVLITGGAGFIGYHLSCKLARLGHRVTGIDNLNDYYDVQLKKDRVSDIEQKYSDLYAFIEMDITDHESLDKLFQDNSFDAVINLAAQAGVQYAKKNPGAYIKANIDGFFGVIDAARKSGCELVVYASSSSVYGGNEKIPFEEEDKCTNPLTVYASSKIANEMIANAYTASFGLRCIGLRFFNVYGPWGRPDAVYFRWSDAIVNQTPLELRDNGNIFRDMTFVDDAVESIIKLIELGTATSNPLHEVFNIGNEDPVKMKDLLDFLTEKFEIEPDEVTTPQSGPEEPHLTRASTAKLSSAVGYAPNTPFRVGINQFVEWYRSYYGR